jgi:hypothetical protein
MNENRSLEQAQKAIRNGNKELGKKLLIQILKENPNSEAAWLWMSAAVDTPELRQECLKKVLEINPQNQHARKGLAKVRGAISSSRSQVSSTGNRTMQPTQDTCSLCGGFLDSPTDYTVHTARVAVWSIGSSVIRVHYDLFQSHDYRVCYSCKKQRNTVWPVVVWALGLVLISLLVPISLPVIRAIAAGISPGGAPSAVRLVIVALLFVLTLGPLVAMISITAAYRRAENALKRKAAKHRKQTSPRWRHGYKGFTDSELRRLEKNMRQQERRR